MLQKWQLQFLARTLWFNQLFGDHRNLFGTRLRLRWAGFHAYGERDEPDRRTVAYGDSGRGPGMAGARRVGRALLQQPSPGRSRWQPQLAVPAVGPGLGNAGGLCAACVAGLRQPPLPHDQEQRTTRTPTVYQRPIEELLSADGIGRYTDITEETRPDDSYNSSQSLYAGYLMLETPVFGRLSATGGLRTEIAVPGGRIAQPVLVPGGPEVKRTDRTDIDYLPGVALKYQLSERMLLRAAYGMTVSRPQIRELAPYQYYDFIRDRNIEGNPELKRTLIHNADLRWEWFFAEGQILAVSGFYKRFNDPIELAILDPASGGSQFRNVTRAQNLGSEFEARINLGRLARALRRLDVDGNLALVRSRLDIPPDLARFVRASRPLAGQSPYVANLSLRFFDEHRGVTASLVYNVVGPRIADVATRVRVGEMDIIPPDIEEQAFHSLDFVASAKVGKHLKIQGEGQEHPHAKPGAEAGRLPDPASGPRHQRIARYCHRVLTFPQNTRPTRTIQEGETKNGTQED